MLIKKPADIRYSEITPKHIYMSTGLSRRTNTSWETCATRGWFDEWWKTSTRFTNSRPIWAARGISLRETTTPV